MLRNLAISIFFHTFALRNENIYMGRLILFVILLFILVFLCEVTRNLLNRDKRTHEEKRKSFDEDIEAVAKKVKMRE